MNGRRTVIDGCAIATVDSDEQVHPTGHIVIEAGRLARVSAGPAPERKEGDVAVDGRGMLATPGLVNCHDHLYQWLTRGYARNANLFEWLVELYPVWARLETEMEGTAARAGLTALARSGCTTSTDHHYVFPRGVPDLLETEIEAARAVGIRFHPTRGSMDLGVSSGGLPPDEVTQTIDEILDASSEAVDRHHDPSFDSMLRIAIAPCSPFSVTPELMRATAELARSKNVRLHTHLAETPEEEEFCLERFGRRPVEYLAELDWVDRDVWFAHCVHMNETEIARLGAAEAGVAHCPSSNARLGAGIAPVPRLLAAGAPVGLGVDGAASNEAGGLGGEIRQALLFARAANGPRAMTPHAALRLATIGGARCLGRTDEIGSLEAGKCADVALWRLDDLDHAGIEDPVAALVLAAGARPERVFVGGREIVSGGRSVTVDEEETAFDLARAAARLAEAAR